MILVFVLAIERPRINRKERTYISAQKTGSLRSPLTARMGNICPTVACKARGYPRVTDIRFARAVSLAARLLNDQSLFNLQFNEFLPVVVTSARSRRALDIEEANRIDVNIHRLQGPCESFSHSGRGQRRRDNVFSVTGCRDEPRKWGTCRARSTPSVHYAIGFVSTHFLNEWLLTSQEKHCSFVCDQGALLGNVLIALIEFCPDANAEPRRCCLCGWRTLALSSRNEKTVEPIPY
jgi:hypothetical protein